MTVNHRALGVIGVRLLAIWMVASGLVFLPQLINVWFWGHLFAHHAQNPAAAEFWLRFVYTLAVGDRLVIAALLWVFSVWLGRFLIPERQSASLEASTSSLVQGAIAIAGLVIAVTAVPTLISRSISTPPYVSTVENSPFAVMGWTYLAMPGILVLLGLGMACGARHLNRLIFRVRTMNPGSADR